MRRPLTFLILASALLMGVVAQARIVLLQEDPAIIRISAKNDSIVVETCRGEYPRLTDKKACSAKPFSMSRAIFRRGIEFVLRGLVERGDIPPFSGKQPSGQRTVEDGIEPECSLLDCDFLKKSLAENQATMDELTKLIPRQKYFVQEGGGPEAQRALWQSERKLANSQRFQEIYLDRLAEVLAIRAIIPSFEDSVDRAEDVFFGDGRDGGTPQFLALNILLQDWQGGPCGGIEIWPRGPNGRFTSAEIIENDCRAFSDSSLKIGKKSWRRLARTVVDQRRYNSSFYEYQNLNTWGEFWYDESAHLLWATPNASSVYQDCYRDHPIYSGFAQYEFGPATAAELKASFGTGSYPAVLKQSETVADDDPNLNSGNGYSKRRCVGRRAQKNTGGY